MSEGRPYAELQANDRQHQDHLSMSGFASNEWFALVHIPIPMEKAFRMPEANAAVQAEWDKLGNRTAWDLSTVRPKLKSGQKPEQWVKPCQG